MRRALVLAMGGALVACGSEGGRGAPEKDAGADGSDGGAPSADGSARDAEGDARAAPSVTGLVIDGSGADATKGYDYRKYPVLAGVRICVYGEPSVSCTVTNPDGSYTLAGAPAGQPFYLSYELTDYEPELYSVTAAAPGTTVTPPPMQLFLLTAVRTSLAQGGMTFDPEEGRIHFGAVMPGPSDAPFHQPYNGVELYYVKGYEVTISPAATAGPLYLSSSWTFDASLTESSDAGLSVFQAPPGQYTLTVTHPTMTCGSTTTLFAAGHVTNYVGVLCTPNAP